MKKFTKAILLAQLPQKALKVKTKAYKRVRCKSCINNGLAGMTVDWSGLRFPFHSTGVSGNTETKRGS